MSEQHPEKPFYATAFGGIVIIIGTVVVFGGLFVWALAAGSH